MKQFRSLGSLSETLQKLGWQKKLAFRPFHACSCPMRHPEHLSVTSASPRAKLAHTMEVVSTEMISPTVKHLTLGRNYNFKFKPGQWVDFWVEELPWVGGFSISSTPQQAQEQGTIDLVVKKSAWPAASWVHNECKPGTQVKLRVGGSFFYEPTGVYDNFGNARNVLLIAGGVGISPIASIFFHLSTYRRKNFMFNCKRSLMYSAKSESDLLFKERFVGVAGAEPDSVRCEFFATKSLDKDSGDGVRCGRITPAALRGALEFLKASEPPLVFICGPPVMAEAIEDMLHSLGMEEKDIFYEKWW